MRSKRAKTKTAIIAFFALTTTAIAAIVTANDIAAAIQWSSTTPDFMKQNAYLFASMAVNQESPARRGYTSDTTARNSCCWGVLQLHWRANRQYFGTSTPQEYAAASLQDQIDGYGNYFSANLNAGSARWMMSRIGQQIGPKTIDAAMVFSCIQIGVGNCERAINAGTCEAARDGSGVSMCQYADNANRPSNCTDLSVCTKNGVGSGTDLAGGGGGGAQNPYNGSPFEGGGGGGGIGSGGGSGIGAGGDNYGIGLNGGEAGSGVGGGSMAGGGSTLPQMARSSGKGEIPIMEGTGN